MNKILIILGPTSTGKTDLALHLAEKFNGELVSCDSRQVYKKLDIGTGKLPNRESVIIKDSGFWEINGIKTWMLDVVDSDKQYSVADYIFDAKKIIGKIIKSEKLPIVVGGTGFYIKALFDGLPHLGLPVDLKVRKQLGKMSLEKLQKKVQALNLQKWEKMNNSDKQNSRRLIRVIELAMIKPKMRIKKNNSKIIDIINYDLLKIGLNAPRDVLYRKSDERVLRRIRQGMIEEAVSLHKEGLSFKRMKQLGLEYGILADYLDDRIKTKKELARILQFKIHAYIRRQLTWFKKQVNINWYDITDKNYIHKVEKQIAKWYYQPYAAKN